MSNPEERQRFLLTLFLGETSVMELESLEDLGDFDFKILDVSTTAALIECKSECTGPLINRLGGSFKIARVLSDEIASALDKIDLPFEPKFDWTVSAYECNDELFQQAREELHDLLKSRGLGKSKYLEQEIELQQLTNARKKNEQDNDKILKAEVKASEIQSRILEPSDGKTGLDFVVHGHIDGRTTYAQTIATSDFRGYETRDFMRPNQEPKKTLSPRIARILVNLSVSRGAKTLLDPFCGIGTILQEGMLCGCSVVGVDRSLENVQMTRENLGWMKQKYSLGGRGPALFAYDARRISRARMPEVSAIATEPILLPAYKKNPGTQDANAAIFKVKGIYERCIKEFSAVLGTGKRRIAITSPVIVDSSGKRRSFSLKEAALDSGLKEFRGRISGRRVNYPLELETGRKRIVQRALNVFQGM